MQLHAAWIDRSCFENFSNSVPRKEKHPLASNSIMENANSLQKLSCASVNQRALEQLLDMIANFALVPPTEEQTETLGRWLSKVKERANRQLVLLTKSYFINIALLPEDCHHSMAKLAHLAKLQYNGIWQGTFSGTADSHNDRKGLDTVSMIKMEKSALENRLHDDPFAHETARYSFEILLQLLKATYVVDFIDLLLQYHENYATLLDRDYKPRIRAFIGRFNKTMCPIMTQNQTLCAV